VCNDQEHIPSVEEHATGGDKAPEVVVTPEMIEAGLDVLYATPNWVRRSREWDGQLMAEILSAALARFPL
jgi:hypothetical protein